MQCLLCYEFLSGLEYLLLRMFLETISKHKLGKQKGAYWICGCYRNIPQKQSGEHRV